MCVYTELIHVVVQQKLTQHCKAVILQFKKKKKGEKKEKLPKLGDKGVGDQHVLPTSRGHIAHQALRGLCDSLGEFTWV